MVFEHSRSEVNHDSSYRAYRLFSSAFIELDDGDKRFLRALSQALWTEDTDYVLTISHVWVLVHLGDAEGRTMAELAQLLICDKSNVTAIVDKLEERGWASRSRGKAGDRRYMCVILTESGWEVRRVVMEAHRERVQRRLAALSDEHLDQLIALLRSVRRTVALDPAQVVREVMGSGARHAAERSA